MKNYMPLFEWSPGILILDDIIDDASTSSGHDDFYDPHLDSDNEIFLSSDDSSCDSSPDDSTASSINDYDAFLDKPLIELKNLPDDHLNDNIITDNNSSSSSHSIDSCDDDDNIADESNTSSITDVSTNIDAAITDDNNASITNTLLPASRSVSSDPLPLIESIANNRPKRSESAKQRQNYIPDFKGKSCKVQFLQHTKQRKKYQPVINNYYCASVNVMFT